jgi:hypothetical protein
MVAAPEAFREVFAALYGFPAFIISLLLFYHMLQNLSID